MPEFRLSMAIVGALGGLLPDVLRFIKGRHEGFPNWFRKGGYWVGLALLVVLGGVAAWLGNAKQWQAALALGFGAPEFFSRLAGSESATVRGSGSGFALRRWWAR